MGTLVILRPNGDADTAWVYIGSMEPSISINYNCRTTTQYTTVKSRLTMTPGNLQYCISRNINIIFGGLLKIRFWRDFKLAVLSTVWRETHACGVNGSIMA